MILAHFLAHFREDMWNDHTLHKRRVFQHKRKQVEEIFEVAEAVKTDHRKKH